MCILKLEIEAQEIPAIDSAIYSIESQKYFDTVFINTNSKELISPIQIIGYFKDNKLRKTIAKYSNSSRKRLTYYGTSLNIPICVKDYDSMSNEMLMVVYGIRNDIFKSEIKKPFIESEMMEPFQVLKHSDFSKEMIVALQHKQAHIYKFLGKLVETVPLPPHCGIIAFAVVHKYKVIWTNCENYNFENVLIIEPCPESKREEFFERNADYAIEVSTNSGVAFDYNIWNNYELENISTFWSVVTQRKE